MAEINLLSEELRPKKEFVKLANLLKKLAAVAVVLFFTSLLVVFGAFLILRNRIQVSKERGRDLISEIKALEQTEQRLLLTRDRLEKAEKVAGAKSTVEGTEMLAGLIGVLGEGVVFQRAQIEDDQTNIALVVDSSKTLSELLTSLVGLQTYKQIELLSLTFDPNKGYGLQFSLLK
jgi:Tfp pilus assembly protein PilN